MTIVAAAYGHLVSDGLAGPAVVGAPVTGLIPAVLTGFYGQTIPVGIGTRRVNGTIIWSAPFEVHTNSDGTTYQTGNFAVSFGMRSGGSSKVQITRLWIDGQLLFDRYATEGRARIPGIKYSLYGGTETQRPDPTIEAFEGAGNVPAFRDLIYAVFRNFDLTAHGLNKLPIVRAEITEFANLEYQYEQFTRLTTLSGDVEPGQSLFDFENFRLYAHNYASGIPVLRTFDARTNVELSQNYFYDRRVPGNSPSAGSLVMLPDGTAVYSPAGNQTVIEGVNGQQGAHTMPAASGKRITDLDFGSPINLPTGIVSDGVLVTRIHEVDGVSQPNNLSYFDGLTGDCLAVDYSTQEQYQSIASGNVGTQCYVLAMNLFWATCRVYLSSSDNLKSINSVHADNQSSIRTLPAAVTGEDAISGTSCGANLVDLSARPVGYSAANTGNPGPVFYFTRGKRLHALHRPRGSAYHNNKGIYYNWIWREELTLGGNYKFAHMVIDPTDGDLFCILKDTVTGKHHPAKIKTPKAADFAASPATARYLTFVHDVRYIGAPIPVPNWGGSGYGSAQQANTQDLTSGVYAYKADNYNDAGGAYVFVDMSSGSYDVAGTAGIVPADPFNFIDVDRYRVLDTYGYGTGTQAPQWIILDVLSGDGKVALADVIYWAAANSGYDEDDITIEGIDDRVWGALISQSTQFTALLEQLSNVFDFDFFESEGKIKIVRVAVGADLVLRGDYTLENLAPLSEGDDAEAHLKTTRLNPDALPYAVSVGYIAKDLDYSQNSVTAHRTNFPAKTQDSQATVSFDVPIIFDTAEVYKIALKLLYKLWASNISHEFRLSWSELLLEPSDVVRINLDGQSFTIKPREVTINQDWSLSVGGRGVSVVSLPEFPFDTGTPVSDETVTDNRSQVVFIDIPSIGEDDNTYDPFPTLSGYRYWTALLSLGQPGWKSGVQSVVYSGRPEEQQGAFSEQPLWGQLYTVPSVLSDQTYLDHGGLTATYRGGDLASVTNIDATKFTNGEAANYAVYGKAGRWELIAFRDFADNGDGTFTISELVRGMRGTELALKQHAALDFLIVLGPAVVPREAPLDQLGRTAILKARGAGASTAEARSVLAPIRGATSIPFAVTGVRAVLTGSDIVITWARRDRSDLDWPDDGSLSFTDPPLYTIALNVGVTPRVVDGLTVETFTYTAAMQATDAFTAPTIDVQIWHVNGVGPGFSEMKTVTIEV